MQQQATDIRATQASEPRAVAKAGIETCRAEHPAYTRPDRAATPPFVDPWRGC